MGALTTPDIAVAQAYGERLGRIRELDALRGLAALSVLLFHYTARYEDLYGHEPDPLVVFRYGDFGVPLFFVLSGFVILMTLDRGRPIREFAVTRFARIFPAYWAAVLLTFALLRVAGLPGREPSFTDALLNATMVHSLFGVRHVDGVYWTLQAELFFYIVMASLVASGQRRRLELFLAAPLALHLSVPLLAWWWSGSGSVAVAARRAEVILFAPHFHAFLPGLIIYAWRTGGRRWWHAGLIGLCLACAWKERGPGYAAGVAAAAALVWAATHARLPLLAGPPLVALGAVSYTLYLVHQNLGYVVIRWCSARGVGVHGAILLATIAALTVAAALSFTVERPAMRWFRRRLERGRISATVEPA